MIDFQYFIIVLSVLICVCSLYAVAWIWPQCMGFSLDPEALMKSVQRNYGVTGQDQLTAAVDLAQASVTFTFITRKIWKIIQTCINNALNLQFNCCGIHSANEYDTSLWRLQGLGQPLAVPLTCCILKNRHEDRFYLNPVPINTTLCQALEKETHQGYRHTVVSITY